MALGENRWAFAVADYEFVFFLMTISAPYQRLVDQPANRAAVITSGRLAKDLRSISLNMPMPQAILDEIDTLADDWTMLTERRNNLAHAWGYSENGTAQLGGYCHKFPKGLAPVHTLMKWSVADLNCLTNEYRTIHGRIRNCRVQYENWRDN